MILFQFLRELTEDTRQKNTFFWLSLLIFSPVFLLKICILGNLQEQGRDASSVEWVMANACTSKQEGRGVEHGCDLLSCHMW